MACFPANAFFDSNNPCEAPNVSIWFLTSHQSKETMFFFLPKLGGKLKVLQKRSIAIKSTLASLPVD